MLQSVIKVGNSLAVTLPKVFVLSRKVQAGQKVFVDSNADLDLVQIRTKNGHLSRLTPEFKEWLDGVSSKYEKLIKELAKR